uniref:Uncharacterized protein n=1 Tax=Biomphalaria glabrata TaxID=6526 RepID=A0A2C9M370_BIOGL
MEPTLTGNRLVYNRRSSSIFKRKMYPMCGVIDFLHVCKGRSFLEPLFDKVTRTPTCQRINGLGKRGLTGRVGCFVNLKFIACVTGSAAPGSRRSTMECDVAPCVYTTDFLDRKALV